MAERNLSVTSIKIPKGIIEAIDKDIEKNEDFRNRSEWIVAAIRSYLDERIEIIEKRNKILGCGEVANPRKSSTVKEDVKEE